MKIQCHEIQQQLVIGWQNITYTTTSLPPSNYINVFLQSGGCEICFLRRTRALGPTMRCSGLGKGTRLPTLIKIEEHSSTGEQIEQTGTSNKTSGMFPWYGDKEARRQ